MFILSDRGIFLRMPKKWDERDTKIYIMRKMVERVQE
jgi:hypothetical protein